MVVHKTSLNVSVSLKGHLALEMSLFLEWYDYFGLFNTNSHILELSQANSGILITMCLRASHFLAMKPMRSIRDKRATLKFSI